MARGLTAIRPDAEMPQNGSLSGTAGSGLDSNWRSPAVVKNVVSLVLTSGSDIGNRHIEGHFRVAVATRYQRVVSDRLSELYIRGILRHGFLAQWLCLRSAKGRAEVEMLAKTRTRGVQFQCWEEKLT